MARQPKLETLYRGLNEPAADVEPMGSVSARGLQLSSVDRIRDTLRIAVMKELATAQMIDGIGRDEVSGHGSISW